MTPFLSIVTRCYKRPQMLRQCLASVDAQTCDKWEQLLIYDEVGRGVGWANRQFAAQAHHIAGAYVLMLDDDDAFACDDAVQMLQDATVDNPEMVIFRGDHLHHGILPTDKVWQKRPQATHISGQDFITRVDVWRRWIPYFGVERMGDITFLNVVWPNVKNVVWLDKVLVKQQRVSLGAAE